MFKNYNQVFKQFLGNLKQITICQESELVTTFDRKNVILYIAFPQPSLVVIKCFFQ